MIGSKIRVLGPYSTRQEKLTKSLQILSLTPTANVGEAIVGAI